MIPIQIIFTRYRGRSRQRIVTCVRVPSDTYERLHALAAENERSLNKQVMYLLRRAHSGTSDVYGDMVRAARRRRITLSAHVRDVLVKQLSFE